MKDAHARFDVVVRPHLADALALARWITRNTADAEDVLQEACMRALRSIHTCAGRNTRAWVLTILRNTAYSWLEKNRRADLIAIDDLALCERDAFEVGGSDHERNSSTPESELIEKLNSAQLLSAIDRLPVGFRETLVLRDIHGLGYRDIASIIGVPVGTVMSRLARARRYLLGILQGHEPQRRPKRRAS